MVPHKHLSTEGARGNLKEKTLLQSLLQLYIPIVFLTQYPTRSPKNIFSDNLPRLQRWDFVGWY
jgi:hypothetical protein